MNIVNCSSLNEIRQNIDKIDKEIVFLLSQRGEYVKQAIKFKRTFGEIKDTKRIDQIINNAVIYAKELGFDAHATEYIYRHLIKAFIQLEENAFAREE